MFCSNRYSLSVVLVLLVVLISFLGVALANSLCHYDERSALLEFKQSFILDCQAPWSPPFALPITLSWEASGPNYGNCCLWDGVECNNETGHVIGLDLSSSCLYGSLPANITLFGLPYLEELNLAFNNFNNSPIPSQVGHKFSKLTSLNLSHSAFSGQVPSSISKLSSLSLLDLSRNFGLQIKGLSLDKLVRNLTYLNLLILDSVDISSPVPNLFANLTSLEALALSFSNLYGEFPTNLFHLPHLEYLDVSGNPDLTGFLPKFEHTSPLRTLMMATTSFSGELPSSIGNLAHMQKLILFGNKFSGQLPSSIGNLTKLTTLELSYNDFSGDLPSSFTNLTQLRQLDFSHLTAPKLFPWLSKLNKLFRLGLPNMNLTGEIPTIMANFTSLIYLDLGNNHLTGNIPGWFMNLTQLEILILSDNQLAGSIQPWISHLEYLDSLYLDGNNKLHANFDTLLKVRNLKALDLSDMTVTFHANSTAKDSVAKVNDLFLNSCNLTEFPPFLLGQNELQLLLLKNNGIQGVIPRWFVNVTGDDLLQLDLSFNSLTGFEQPTKVLPWDNLEILKLDGNKIQGSLPIPSNSIKVYHISNNSLTGDIPQELCQASSLAFLDLSFNHLGGQIPECIGHLGGSLQILNIQGNTFHGNIPHVYPKSCKLKMINLSKNQLTGNMPRSLANCRMLEVLDIGSNQVNDTFPSWLGSLPNLQILVLRHNNFHGRIGTQNAFSGFHSLRIIDFSHNFHTGSLPFDYLKKWDAMKVANEAQLTAVGTSITLKIRSSSGYFLPVIHYDYTITIANKGNEMLYTKILSVYRVIDFSTNNFTGRIPYFIGKLKGLQAINLSNNNLEGGIPLSLANIRDLESLDLSNNKLSGEIPQQLTHLTYLEVCNVSHNLLIGPIPHGNQFDTFDNSSFDGNLRLCGGTLSKRCGNAEKSPPSASVTDNKEDDNSSVIDWVIISSGCVCGFVVGCAIGKYMTDRSHEWFVDTFSGRKRRLRATSKRRS